jgi:hypothetical protein
VDLLGHIREEAGNQAAACRAGLLGAEGGDAQALLLAGLPSSLMQREAAPPGSDRPYLGHLLADKIAIPGQHQRPARFHERQRPSSAYPSLVSLSSVESGPGCSGAPQADDLDRSFAISTHSGCAISLTLPS